MSILTLKIAQNLLITTLLSSNLALLTSQAFNLAISGIFTAITDIGTVTETLQSALDAKDLELKRQKNAIAQKDSQIRRQKKIPTLIKAWLLKRILLIRILKNIRIKFLDFDKNIKTGN